MARRTCERARKVRAAVARAESTLGTWRGALVALRECGRTESRQAAAAALAGPPAACAREVRAIAHDSMAQAPRVCGSMAQRRRRRDRAVRMPRAGHSCGSGTAAGARACRVRAVAGGCPYLRRSGINQVVEGCEP